VTGPLVDRAQAAGVACHVLAMRSPLRTINRDHLFISTVRSWKSLLSFVRFVLRVKVLLRRMRPDCIHANVPKSHITLFLLCMLGYRGACCFHLRELFVARGTAWWTYRLLFPRRRGSVLAISYAVKQGLPRRLQAHAQVIYNGIALGDVAQKKPLTESIKFIYLGRIVPWKGCHILINIFGRLVKKYPGKKLSLSLVGDTLYWPQKYRTELAGLIASEGLQGRCMLLPHTETPQEMLLSHDVFCCASRDEPFGRSLAEALGCGLPVVSFSGGAAAEIIVERESGLLVPYSDEEAFVAAMAWFVENSEQIRPMGLKGFSRASTLFNRDIQMPKIASFLLSLAKSGRVINNPS
ncbi:MAG: glycosyltransferase family 4 protein, partial [Chitinivibrionales bacterium]|nr:glycosyltransferase family 4 protein [Chitinivibrionales bacterium]